MGFVNRHIIDTYTELLENLSESNKNELLENLTRSVKPDSTKKESDFFKSFGAFGSTKKAEKIIKEIRSARKFRKKAINL